MLFFIIYYCFGFLITKINSLPNVFFLPGLAGNFLYATIDSSAILPKTCLNVPLPIKETFLIYTNITLTLQHADCLSDLLSLEYNPTDGSFHSPVGITITTEHFGQEISITPVYHSFFQQLESWGVYQKNKNLFGIPYDFRYSTEQSLQQIGFMNNFQQLIERSYRLNGEKAMLIGHSNGGPTLYTFLNAMSRVWKEKYVVGMMTLSGNLLGQLNAMNAFFGDTATSKPLEIMATTWESMFTSTPWGEYDGLAGITDFIVTYNGTAEKETHYTPRLQDIQSLFTSVNRNDWNEKLTTLYPSMDRRQAPQGVDVYCLYGADVETTYAYVFEESITDNDPSLVLTMDGDGNQDIIDNEFCITWKETVMNQEKKVFESKKFSGVSHMQMYSDENVLAEVQRILFSYSGSTLKATILSETNITLYNSGKQFQMKYIASYMYGTNDCCSCNRSRISEFLF